MEIKIDKSREFRFSAFIYFSQPKPNPPQNRITNSKKKNSRLELFSQQSLRSPIFKSPYNVLDLPSKTSRNP
jgi:hypothetical protein